MSFKKEQRNYNKQIVQTGKQANKYLQNALGLINKYTTDYSGRLDYWTNKLNDRQTNLLSDKYLKQNADMLRGQSAFGSNSSIAQQQAETAYDQNNYLADVMNKNVQAANQLQSNELQALYNASSAYQNPIASGKESAQIVDSTGFGANLLGSVGKTAQAAGTALSFVNPAIGAAVAGAGSVMSNLADTGTTYYNQDQLKQVAGYTQNYANSDFAQSGGLSGRVKNLSTQIKNRDKSSGSLNVFG